MTDPPWQEEEEYDARPWWQRYRTGLIIAGVIAMFALLSLPSILARDQIDTLENDVSNLQEDLGQVRGAADANKAALDEANRLLIELGEEPVPVPDVDAEVNDPDPDDPEVQDPEIQDPETPDGEIQDPDVNDLDPFDDPDPDDPDPNDPVSFEDLVSAVTAFCEVNPDACRGPQGEAGVNGTDGVTTCPLGFHFEEALVITSRAGPATAMVCVADSPPR